MSNNITQEQYSDLKKYIPASDMVKLAFSDMESQGEDTWEATLEVMIQKALSGDRTSLFELLELTYTNAHNEGWIDGIEEHAFNRA